MTDHSIKGIYEMRISSDIHAIIVSTASKKDPLRYDYYMLSVDAETEHVDVKKINSPILLAKDSQYSIHKLNNESDAYKLFEAHFNSFHNASVQTSAKLHFKEPLFNSPKLTKRNQIKNRT